MWTPRLQRKVKASSKSHGEIPKHQRHTVGMKKRWVLTRLKLPCCDLQSSHDDLPLMPSGNRTGRMNFSSHLVLAYFYARHFQYPGKDFTIIGWGHGLVQCFFLAVKGKKST